MWAGMLAVAYPAVNGHPPKHPMNIIGGGPGRGGDAMERSAGGAATSGQVSRRPGEVSIKYLSRLGEGTV